jgi:hypothetical protein
MMALLLAPTGAGCRKVERPHQTMRVEFFAPRTVSMRPWPGCRRRCPVVCRARLALQLWPRKSTAMRRAMMTVLKANATSV